MIEEIVISGKSYRFESFVGTVVEASHERETRVTGSGGGGYSFDGFGSTQPIEIKSETVVHKNFFLVDEQGNERHYDVSDWQMPIRAGHQLQMLGVMTKNATTPLLVGLNSRNMAQFEWRDRPIHDAVKSYYGWLSPLIWVVSAAVAYGFGSWKLFLILLVSALLIVSFKTKKIEKQIVLQLDKMAMNKAAWNERYPQGQ